MQNSGISANGCRNAIERVSGILVLSAAEGSAKNSLNILIKDDRMRLLKIICLAAFFLPALFLFNSQKMVGQVLQPIEQPGQNTPKQEKKAAEKPYKVSSRFHLQQGTNKGYLVVKIELDKGSYIYSLTQKQPLRPSKIRVAESLQFKLKSGFTSDRLATVVEKDPVFDQRVEKHRGVIQFFASLEIAPGVDVKTITADVALSGQVCTDEGFCMPIIGAKTTGKFAGYFERTAEKPESSPRSTGSDRKLRRP